MWQIVSRASTGHGTRTLKAYSERYSSPAHRARALPGLCERPVQVAAIATTAGPLNNANFEKTQHPGTEGVQRLTFVPDAGDPRLADYTRLTDVELRKSLEAEHGLFVAEGEKVIRRAVAAGYAVRSLLATERRAAGLEDLAEACGAPAYVVPDHVAERLTGYHVHRGALAAMRRRPLPGVADMLAGTRAAVAGQDITDHANVGGSIPHARPVRRILVLEDIVDHGNVGGIFRCAAALGVDAVILSPRCADPLYRRAVKVSMGAVFAVPYARMTDWYGGLAALRAAGFRLLALTPDQSAVPLDRAPLTERVGLMLGTEGDGLSSRWLHEADVAVCIPMHPGAMAAGVDSLNVMAAAAIACQQLSRPAMADPG
jgi:tRNA G18 (ribose-2'-O)-methylase SpoU